MITWREGIARACAALITCIGSATPAALGQQVPFSQRGAVWQMLGQTEITIRYSRPTARGRRLYGGIVRWGRPWNPGADSATTIAVSLPIRVQGQALPAGTYSVWAIPDSVAPWTIVFSRAHPVFHTPYPGEEHDQLRLSAAPVDGAHMETLAWYFPAVSGLSATLHLHWGTTVIPLQIEAGP